jgi:glutathione S-transferase
MLMSSQDSIKIYGVPFSVHTRKVIMVCKIKQIATEIRSVVPVDPSTLPSNWSTLSPTGLIPVISDGDVVLSDSTAIALYLERKHPSPAILPDEMVSYGRTLAWDAWAGSALFSSVNRPLFHNQIVSRLIHKVPGDEAAISAALSTAAPRAFSYLEQQLQGTSFLVGGRLSLADLAVVSNLMLFHYLGHRIDATRFPKLSRYLRAQIDSDTWRETLKAELPLIQGMGLDGTILS